VLAFITIITIAAFAFALAAWLNVRVPAVASVVVAVAESGKRVPVSYAMGIRRASLQHPRRG
jgi:hypothetical protein